MTVTNFVTGCAERVELTGTLTSSFFQQRCYGWVRPRYLIQQSHIHSALQYTIAALQLTKAAKTLRLNR